MNSSYKTIFINTLFLISIITAAYILLEWFFLSKTLPDNLTTYFMIYSWIYGAIVILNAKKFADVKFIKLHLVYAMFAMFLSVVFGFASGGQQEKERELKRQKDYDSRTFFVKTRSDFFPKEGSMYALERLYDVLINDEEVVKWEIVNNQLIRIFTSKHYGNNKVKLYIKYKQAGNESELINDSLYLKHLPDTTRYEKN